MRRPSPIISCNVYKQNSRIKLQICYEGQYFYRSSTSCKCVQFDRSGWSGWDVIWQGMRRQILYVSHHLSYKYNNEHIRNVLNWLSMYYWSTLWAWNSNTWNLDVCCRTYPKLHLWENIPKWSPCFLQWLVQSKLAYCQENIQMSMVSFQTDCMTGRCTTYLFGSKPIA